LSVRIKKLIFSPKLFFLAIFVISTLLISYTFLLATSDGELGATSEGSADMTLEIARLVRLSNMADVAFGQYSGSGDLSADRDVCVWTNDADATYVVTATGDGEDSAFTVSAAAELLAYTVYWNDTASTDNNILLTANQVSAAMGNANTSSHSCGGVDNANFQVIINQTSLLASRPGTYTGVLTFVVAPAP